MRTVAALVAMQMGATRAMLPRVPGAGRFLGARRVSTQGMSMSAYDFSARDLDTDAEVSLDKYKGKVSLIVNVASK